MKAQILPPSFENISLAAESLRQGEIGAMPTETVYGLAGAAFDPKALARIFDVKERPSFDPLILHVPSMDPAIRLHRLEKLRLIDLHQFSDFARSRAELLLSKFWPGPFTLVLPKHEDVPELATGGLPSVGVRMPRHPIAQALISAAGFPLAAPSANRFGKISPTSSQDVLTELGDRISWILDGGSSEIGLESTVVELDPKGKLSFLRPGAISIEALEQAIGDSVSISTSFRQSPGHLENHYAPSKPLFLLPRAIQEIKSFSFLPPFPKGTSVGLLIYSGDPQEKARFLETQVGLSVTQALVLSSSGLLEEAAQSLFSCLRSLDEGSACFLVAEPCPSNQGLGYAIRDRLYRASHKSSSQPV